MSICIFVVFNTVFVNLFSSVVQGYATSGGLWKMLKTFLFSTRILQLNKFMEPNVKVLCLLRMFQEGLGEPVYWGIGQIEQNLIIKKNQRIKI